MSRIGRPPRDWPIDQIRTWIEQEQRTHRWVADQLDTSDQHVSRLCQKHGIRVQGRGPRPGAGHPEWRGGRSTDKHGYILVWVESHPHAKRRPGQRHPGGYVREHRLVMEQALGRFLDPKEVVHHLNGNKSDNRPENLELYTNNAQHLRAELTGRVPNWSPEGRARQVEALRAAEDRRLAGVRRHAATLRERKARGEQG
jgi:hypothetical protein